MEREFDRNRERGEVSMRVDPMKMQRTMSATFKLNTLFLVVALVGVGCSSVSAVKGGADEASKELLARLRSEYASTPLLTMHGSMAISGVPATIWYDALVARRDSMRVDLTGPFGIPVGALLATPETFLFFNAQEGEAVEGRPDRKTFSELMMVDMEYQEMASMLRGELPRFPEDDTYSTSRVGDVVTYTVKRARTTEVFSIDASSLQLQSYTRSRGQGGDSITEIAISYKDYIKLGGRSFPRKATVEINNAEQRIAVVVEKIKDSIDNQKSFALNLPPGTSRKRL